MDGSRALVGSGIVIAFLCTAPWANDDDPEAAPGIDLVHEHIDAAETHGQAGRLDEAASALDEALAALAKVNHQLSQAIHLVKIGRLYERIPQHRRRAARCFERAHQLCEPLDTPARLLVLHRLGNVTLYNAPRRAVGYLEETLPLHREAADRRGEAGALESLGLAYRNLGDVQKAMERAQRARDIFRAAGEPAAVVRLTHQLGGLHQRMGKSDRALELYNASLALREEHDLHAGQGSTLNAIGVIYKDRHQFKEALEYYNRAREAHQKDGSRYGEGSVLGNLAVLHDDLGRPELAIEYYEQAVPIYRERNNLRDVAISYLNLGIIHGFSLGNLETAEFYYREAEKLSQQVGDRHLYAGILASLGSLFSEKGENEEALHHEKRAAEMFEQLGAPRQLGRALGNLGGTYNTLGQPEEAWKAWERALEIHREVGNRGSEALILRTMAQALVVREEYELARQHFRAALAIENATLQGVEQAFEEGTVESFVDATVADDTSLYLIALRELAAEADDSKEKASYLEEGLQVLETLRARVLAAVMRGVGSDRLLSAEGKQTWDRIGELREESARLATEKRRAQQRGEPGNHSGQVDEELRSRQQQIETLLRSLKRNEPVLRAVAAEGTKIRTADLRELLQPGEVLLYYSLGGAQRVHERGGAAHVFVWSAEDGLELHLLPKSPRDFHDGIGALLSRLHPTTRASTNISDEVFAGGLRSVRAALFHGFEAKVQAAERLTIIGDSVLENFPFEILLFDDGERLVEKCAVRYAPSLRVLRQLRERPEERAPLDLVAFGAPDFGTATQRPETEEVALVVRDDDLRDDDVLDELTHARREVETIATLFSNSSVHTGARASERRFKQEAHRGKVLHVATHGRHRHHQVHRQNEDHDDHDGHRENALLHAGLAFAGYNAAGDGVDDGFLSGLEVLHLDLRPVDLVVLSACETQRGSLQSQEGKVGLERAFFASGVRSVLGSLWNVDDEATGRFMKLFYEALREGHTKTQALREAKLAFLRRGKELAVASREKKGNRGLGTVVGRHGVERQGDFSDPVFWAPFILSGDDTSVYNAVKSSAISK